MTVQFYVKPHTPFCLGENLKLLYVCKADKSQTAIPSVLHSHENCLEMLYIYEGKGRHMIDHQFYATKKGDLLIYNKGVLHDECANPEVGMGVYNCGITGLHLPGLSSNTLIPDDIVPVLHCGEYQKAVCDLFDLMYRQVSEQYVKAENIAYYILHALLNIVLHQIPLNRQASTEDEEKLSLYIKDYIDNHYLEINKLDDLGDALHISLSYLSFLVKKETGLSPMQYIMRRKIGRAQSLLITTDYNITKIASLVGYDKVSHFNELFKRNVRMSPGQYRRYSIGDKSREKMELIRSLKLR